MSVDFREIDLCLDCSQKWGICVYHCEKFGVNYKGEPMEPPVTEQSKPDVPEDLKDLNNDSGLIATLIERIARLTADLKRAEEQAEAWHLKFEGCPHKLPTRDNQMALCACSYDDIKDVCALHAPLLRQAQSDLRRAEERIARLSAPVSDEEIGMHGVLDYNRNSYVLKPDNVNKLIAARSNPARQGEENGRE